jgi:hypothetical protein
VIGFVGRRRGGNSGDAGVDLTELSAALIAWIMFDVCVCACDWVDTVRALTERRFDYESGAEGVKFAEALRDDLNGRW